MENRITFKSMQDTTKTMRVWWHSNGRDTYYYVDSVKDAMVIIDVLALREVGDDSVWMNMDDLEVLEDGEWCTWYDEDGYDIEEYLNEDRNL